MKNQQKKALYIVLLLFLFGLIGATFCYFMGITDTLGEAFTEFLRFGKWLLPAFIAAFSLILYDLNRLNRKNRE